MAPFCLDEVRMSVCLTARAVTHTPPTPDTRWTEPGLHDGWGGSGIEKTFVCQPVIFKKVEMFP